MFLAPIAVHLLLVREGRVLLLRRYNTGYEDGNYSVVAGHVEGGEELKTAMVREAREEAGIGILPSDLEVVGAMHVKTDKEYISFFFKASVWSGDVTNMEPDKCDELRWSGNRRLAGQHDSLRQARHRELPQGRLVQQLWLVADWSF